MPSSKKQKMEPLVAWGEACSNTATCVRSWLMGDRSLEEEVTQDWRKQTPSPTQTPSTKLKQMELEFGQLVKEVKPERDNKWDMKRPKTGKLSKKEKIEMTRLTRKYVGRLEVRRMEQLVDRWSRQEEKIAE